MRADPTGRHFANARIGEVSSGGIGPHDIKLLPNGRLVVANGGIDTHPESGRAKLNLATMRPNLTYLSVDGQVLETVELEEGLRLNSIRHLAVDGAGRVGMAMQWQGDVSEEVPLLAVHDAQTSSLTIGAAEHQRSLQGYVGSIAMAGGAVAITSPRGSLAQIYTVNGLDLSHQIERPDICGVAAFGQSFVTTTGDGLFERHDRLHEAKEIALSWDNHLVGLST
ncbi:MAG: DUF1513 domain-containing protein, partial [Pseudomonadota bacterium]